MRFGSELFESTIVVHEQLYQQYKNTRAWLCSNKTKPERGAEVPQWSYFADPWYLDLEESHGIKHLEKNVSILSDKGNRIIKAKAVWYALGIEQNCRYLLPYNVDGGKMNRLPYSIDTTLFVLMRRTTILSGKSKVQRFKHKLDFKILLLAL